jgi:putative peptide zinc metalloprotease protein
VTIEDGEPVRHTNDAHAYASCRDCVTGATAFQVILIVGNSDEIAPVNAAAAANYHCVNCHTYAFAYQIVASVTEVTPEVQEALEAAHERLRKLEAQASSLTGAEIHTALEEVEHSLIESLDDVIAVDTDSDSALPQTSGEGEPTSDPAASSP